MIRSLHSLGRLEHAFCTETRPYNQGARLTAFELVYEHIPATLITDSMAAAAMAHKGVSGGHVLFPGRWPGQGGRGLAIQGPGVDAPPAHPLTVLPGSRGGRRRPRGGQRGHG